MSKDEDKSRYPYGVIIFLFWYFCEKYCFVCYVTILTLYLTEDLELKETFAASLFHIFLSTSYFLPLVGGILADAWLGSFWAIIHVSMIYSLGNILSCLSAFPLTVYSRKALIFVGILLAGVGAGGIEPCIPVFGGDQFSDDQVSQRQHFFSVFYAISNAANLIATFISPVLRGDFQCFDKPTCYSLAFGFAAGIFITSFVIFAICKPFYKTNPPKGSAFIEVFKCIGHAVVVKTKSKGETKEHWLDYAEGKFDKLLIHDIKAFLRVFLMFIPLPIYWALFAQQGSTWLLQAANMDGEILGFRIKPDNMLLVNPVLVVLMTPLFQYVIYPALSTLGLCKTQIQKMTAGGLITAIAFIMSGFIQLQIEVNSPEKVPPGISDIVIINNTPCSLEIQGHQFQPFKEKSIRVPRNARTQWKITPSRCFLTKSSFETYNINSEFLKMFITISNQALDVKVDKKEKRNPHTTGMSIFFRSDNMFRSNGSSSFLLKGDSKEYYLTALSISYPVAIGMTQKKYIQSGGYKVYLPHNETAYLKKPIGSALFRRGGSYVVGIFQDSQQNISNLALFTLNTPSTVPILYQLPQIIVLSAGEIMFVVTGMDFSYSQAPASVKSVVQSVWLLTRAIGNILVVSIENLFAFEHQSNQFYMYAALLTASMLVFAILGHFYRYMEDR